MLKNCIPTCRQILKHCPDAHLNTCQPLTFTSKFQLTEAAIVKHLVSGTRAGNQYLFTVGKNDTKGHVTYMKYQFLSSVTNAQME